MSICSSKVTSFLIVFTTRPLRPPICYILTITTAICCGCMVNSCIAQSSTVSHTPHVAAPHVGFTFNRFLRQFTISDQATAAIMHNRCAQTIVYMCRQRCRCHWASELRRRCHVVRHLISVAHTASVTV